MALAAHHVLLLTFAILLSPTEPPPPARAARSAPDPLRPPAEARRARYDFTGVISAVDQARNTIVVQTGPADGRQRRTVRYDDRTEFVKSRQPFAIRDVRPDMRVWVYLIHGRDDPRVNLARRLTLADPYPDLYGVVESVDTTARSLVVLRRYPGSAPGDRLQPVTVRASEATQVRMEGREIPFDQIPVGRRVAITSARDARNRPTSVASKITVWRPQSRPAEKPRPDPPAADHVP